LISAEDVILRPPEKLQECRPHLIKMFDSAACLLQHTVKLSKSAPNPVCDFDDAVSVLERILTLSKQAVDSPELSDVLPSANDLVDGIKKSLNLLVNGVPDIACADCNTLRAYQTIVNEADRYFTDFMYMFHNSIIMPSSIDYAPKEMYSSFLCTLDHIDKEILNPTWKDDVEGLIRLFNGIIRLQKIINTSRYVFSS
jgi:hypothetical protein